MNDNIKETKEQKEYYNQLAQRERMKIGSLTITIILLVMIFLVCSYVAYRVVRYEELYGNDPLVYGAIVHNASFCTCVNDEGDNFSFNKKEILYRPKPKNNPGINIDSTKIYNLSISNGTIRSS